MQKIKAIQFLNGWEGKQSIRIKAIMDDNSEVILEHDEAERILLERLNDGHELTLKPMQKLYRVIAK